MIASALIAAAAFGFIGAITVILFAALALWRVLFDGASAGDVDAEIFGERS